MGNINRAVHGEQGSSPVEQSVEVTKCLIENIYILHHFPFTCSLELLSWSRISSLHQETPMLSISQNGGEMWWTWMPSSPKEWSEIRSAPVFHRFLFAASFQHHIQVFTCMQCANQPVRPIHEPFRSVMFLFRTPLFRYSHLLLLQIYMCFKFCLSNTYSACTARNNTKYALESRSGWQSWGTVFLLVLFWL